MKLKINKKLYK